MFGSKVLIPNDHCLYTLPVGGISVILYSHIICPCVQMLFERLHYYYDSYYVTWPGLGSPTKNKGYC
jgi:hypothetical protein